MASVKNIKAFCEAYGAKSILNTKPQKIHGVNPSLTYPLSGKSYDLPRFCSVEMQMARVMNKIAQKNLMWRERNVLNSTKILPADLKRLESATLEDSYKRAYWINPKDNKGYHLLDEGRTKDGMQKLRILDEQGEFVKNAEVKPKTIILSDILSDIKHITSDDGNGLTHTDIINIFARRYNPFAKYKTVVYEKGKESEYFKKLAEKIDDDTFCVSCSFSHNLGTYFPIRGRGKIIKELFMNYLYQNDNKVTDELGKLNQIASKTRVLMSSGNNGDNGINGYLFGKLEGVGGLNLLEKVHKFTSLKNSMFTQHYEPFEFPICVTNEGINITYTRGTDYPMNFNSPSGSYLGEISGTSFSAPIRAAKLALNEMMEGVL